MDDEAYGMGWGTDETGLYDEVSRSAFPADQQEAKRLDPFQQGSRDLAWYERLISYGATRAIDSHYADTEIARLKARYIPGVGFVGANGVTQPLGVFGNSLKGLTASPLALMLLVGLGFMLLKK